MSKAIEIQPPNNLRLKTEYTTIFLAGSIENGLAEEYQRKVINSVPDKQYIFFNPRRDDWDSSWIQDKSNINFRRQVEWELEALELAEYIVMYFDPNTKSPISLLELGLHAKEGKLIVICPNGFYRKGNVDITCEFYKVKQLETIDEFIELLKTDKLKVSKFS